MKSSHKAILVSLFAPLASFAAESFEKVPSLITARMPVFSDSSDDLTGEVLVKVDINQNGFVTDASIKKASSAELAEPCLKAVRQWHYQPAVKDGHAVAATFVQPIHFGSKTLSTEDVSASASVVKSERPDVPSDLEHITGNVTLLVRLSDKGEVTHAEVSQSTHEELNAVCLAAIQKWSFSPAVKQGTKVSSAVRVPFRFIGDSTAVTATAARAEVLADNAELRAVRQSSPQISEKLLAAGGKAQIAFTVDEHGFVSNTVVKTTTNPELAEVARRAMLNWKFSPVVRNGKAVAVNAIQPFNFGEGTVVAEVVDRMPKASHIVEPTMPESLRGVRGRVDVQFNLKDTGEVASVEVKESSAPEMAEPILLAAKQWTFKPAIKGGKPVDSRVVVPFLVGSSD